MRRVVESDICIIGSGITAALIAEKISDERDARIVVVEAGEDNPPLERRFALRDRYLQYGENPWPNDHIDGYSADNIQSRSMQVGGLAMHWGGVTPRFSPEDFTVKSLYGVGDDWPLTYDDLDPFYQEAEERMGIAGEQGPQQLDPRLKPYPLPPLPLSYNLELLKAWGSRADISFWSQPSAKLSQPYKGRSVCCRADTCFPICPVGAKYSPDFTWNRLRSSGKVELITRTIVRRLETIARGTNVTRAIAVDRDRPEEPVEFRARTFVIACGYAWTPYLLLLSQSARFPNGLANSSGLLGKYMNGHRNVNAYIKLPLKLYPGINAQHSLVTKQFMRREALDNYVRHDLRIWESTAGREPRLRNDNGELLLGDALMSDWRRRAEQGAARVRAYYDVLPARNSELTLDSSTRNPWGDPQPRIVFRDDEASARLRGHTVQEIERLFQRMARAGDGEILSMRESSFQDHPGGGCRMGSDPSNSVCDGFGRMHDHENLFVVGAPTSVTGGCANGTLTFVALGLRAASEIGAAFPARTTQQN